MKPSDQLSARDAPWRGHDDLDPKSPSGHEYGVTVSTRLTSNFRELHRKEAMDITPQQVIDCLEDAEVKNWVLMGLHGYVGYLPMPRATQDVDVMIPYSQKKRTVNAVSARWPTLEIRELSQVIRFLDPADRDKTGTAKPVIDIMLPWSPFQETILKSHVLIDKSTGHRLPTIEAAIVSKYAAMISPHRSFDKKEQDAVDLRRLIKANQGEYDATNIASLAANVWEGGSEEIARFTTQALTDQRFE
ncbi:hypothetical protein ACFL2H_10600 [Planctomycetota bacterium]